MKTLEVIEGAAARVDSRYRAVLIAARRAKQLQRGSQRLVESKRLKATSVALEELAAGKIGYTVPEFEEESSPPPAESF